MFVIGFCFASIGAGLGWGCGCDSTAQHRTRKKPNTTPLGTGQRRPVAAPIQLSRSDANAFLR
jgi:hypothetical protein